MNSFYRILAPYVIVGLLAGCSGQPIKIASVTDPSTIDKTRGREIMASGAGFQLFGFIPLSVNDRQQRAYQELLQEAGNDAIADVTIQESWRYAVIGWTFRTTIRAIGYPKIAKAKVPVEVQSPP